MADSTKGNTEILAAPKAFEEAYERARQVFSRIDGVAGVGFGLKETGNALTDRIAIVVFVREKKPEEDLAPADRIPKSFEGYPTDVSVVAEGHAEVCENTTKYDRIQGGIQIEVKSGGNTKGRGTLGCIVKKRGNASRENVHLLTNKHVLFAGTSGFGNTVYHPETGDTELGPVGASFYENVRYPPDGGAAAPVYFADCAIALIHLDSTCCCCTCTKDSTQVSEAVIVDLDVNGENTLRDVRSVIGDVSLVNQKVFKVGRTTGKTQGIVTRVNAPLSADPPPDNPGGARVLGQNLIEVRFDPSSTTNHLNCKGNVAFTEQGDSGSLIVDENNRAIGLHTHRAAQPGGLRSYACHILPVLDYLGICIPCTFINTLVPSHGNSLATDGSGVAPRALPVAESSLPAGRVVFLDGQAPSAPASSPPAFTPLAVTDAEVCYMRELLAELRTTLLGPEIHEMFGRVRREIAYLVRNSRPVKVAWARNKGPAFLTHVLNHVMGRTDSVPHEVQGVTRRQLLMGMREVLSAHGSILLQESLERYGDDVLEVLAGEGSDTVRDCIARLQERELA